MEDLCRKWVGPIWKLGGETCVCTLPAGHPAEVWHRCTCGAEYVDSVAHEPGTTKEPAHPEG